MYHPSRFTDKKDLEKAEKIKQRNDKAQRERRDELAARSFEKRQYDVVTYLGEGAPPSSYEGIGSPLAPPPQGQSAKKSPRTDVGIPEVQKQTQTQPQGFKETSPKVSSWVPPDANPLEQQPNGYTSTSLGSYTLPLVRKIKDHSDTMIDGTKASQGTPFADPPGAFKSIFRTNLNNARGGSPPLHGGSVSSRKSAPAKCEHGSPTAPSQKSGASFVRSTKPQFCNFASKSMNDSDRVQKAVEDNAALVRAPGDTWVAPTKATFRDQIDKVPQMSPRRVVPAPPPAEVASTARAERSERLAQSLSLKNAEEQRPSQSMSARGMASSFSFAEERGRRPIARTAAEARAEKAEKKQRAELKKTVARGASALTSAVHPQRGGKKSGKPQVAIIIETDEDGGDITTQGFEKQNFDSPKLASPVELSKSPPPPFQNLTRAGGSHIPEIAQGYFSKPEPLGEEYKSPRGAGDPRRSMMKFKEQTAMANSGKIGDGLFGPPVYQAL